jgi:hypothetical protein
MDHSYEEIRNVVTDIIAERENVNYPPNQYQHLLLGVAEVFQRREATNAASSLFQREPQLSGNDADLLREVFWDLFRQNIITLGADNSDPMFPWFSVSHVGKRILGNQNPYFFHDLDTYTKLIRSNVPTINDITLMYLQEAMQSFRSGCMLAATVMLGVASEHSFLLLVEAAGQSPTYGTHFGAVPKERTILQKFRKFRAAFEKNVLAALPSEIKENLDIEFDGILSVIRTFRNDSGHPSGKILEREQTYVLLQMFVPYCKKLYQLMDFFR